MLAPFLRRAAEHPDGIVDLSVGTPVDPTPQVAQQSLRAAADWPGYPLTAGTPALRAACAGWLERRLGVVVDEAAVLPSIGTKELVASLPMHLGLTSQSCIVGPAIAYPTYAVSAALLGARYVATDEPESVPEADLIWLNSPSNPTGRVLSVARMREIVAFARERGIPVLSDECYVELGWDVEPVSLLHPDACGGDHAGLLVLHSLSKRSNLAGYRFGFMAGDPALVARVLGVRKHLGLMVPGPVQAAAAATLGDDTHVSEQRARYGARRQQLRAALEAAGFVIEHSEAGLYLWATRGEDCWQTVGWLADRGILVAPGAFYGTAGEQHVRVALTGTDERIAAAVRRLAPS